MTVPRGTHQARAKEKGNNKQVSGREKKEISHN